MESRVTFAMKWVLPSEYGQEKRVLSEISTIIELIDPLSTNLDDILTVVAEACLNAFEHGNRFHENVPVQVGMTIDESNYRFRISDEGEGFQADCWMPDRTKDKEQLRGWGLLLIKNLADRWEYGVSEDKFYIEIEFNRSR